jgi:hypothetical protein
MIIEHDCNSGTSLWNLGEKGKEKNDRKQPISKCKASLQVDDTMMCTEIC